MEKEYSLRDIKLVYRAVFLLVLSVEAGVIYTAWHHYPAWVIMLLVVILIVFCGVLGQVTADLKSHVK